MRVPRHLTSSSTCQGAARHASRRHLRTSAGNFLNDHVDKAIHDYARKELQPVSFKELLDAGKDQSPENLLKNGRYLWREMPIRIAQRIQNLYFLPYGLSRQPTVEKLRGLYKESFEILFTMSEPKTPKDDKVFVERLGAHLKALKPAVPMLAQGLSEMHTSQNVSTKDCPYINDFLNRFYMARIGTRLLSGQHVALHRKVNKDHWIGEIHTQIPLAKYLNFAIQDATKICTNVYGMCPEVVTRDTGIRPFPYFPGHINHIFFEIFKNAMRAVVERHGHKGVENLPPVLLTLSSSDDGRECIIKVSDEGGGISREDAAKVWHYTYSTADQAAVTDELVAKAAGVLPPSRPVDNSMPNKGTGKQPKVRSLGGDKTAPMHGFGYGLPIARLYASYFGGDIKLQSMAGYGTDVYVYLNVLSDDKPIGASLPYNSLFPDDE